MQFGDKLRGTRKELRADARVVSESAVRRLIRSEAAQVLQNLRAGPVLSADELAADDAVLVDTTGLSADRALEQHRSELRTIAVVQEKTWASISTRGKRTAV